MSKKVIILGGGVGGMTAAHELIERGFDVEIYERNAGIAGGKARSVPVPGTAVGGSDPLYGEHGFRFFPGFYKHLPDTMGRIPYGKKTVFDNLVPTDTIMIARYDNNAIVTNANFPDSLADIKVLLNNIFKGVDSGLTSEEINFFALRMWQLMTSCYDRRLNEYERIGWWEYCEADRFSDAYRSLLVEGLTRTLVAAKADIASTRTGGDIFLQLMFNMTTPGVQTDRVLNGPTNLVWIEPWLDYLKSKGVNYNFNSSVQSLETDGTSITGVTVSVNGKTKSVTGDYYVLAVPVEVAATLMSDAIIKIDPTLEALETLAGYVSWMNGIQFYLNEDVQINKGHVIYSDSEWAITSISQLQFWDNYNIENCYNGKVKHIISVDVSDWDTPGMNGKKANECSSREEVKNEVWAQLKKSLNVEGKTVLRDDMIETWYLDRDIEMIPNQSTMNREPLLVNHVNSWTFRPAAHTGVPNLFLASDYVKTYTDLATMECANEAARRAVNSIIDVSDTKAPLCKLWNLHEPDVLVPFRGHDKSRYENGLPWRDEFSETAKEISKIKGEIKNLEDKVFSKKKE